MNYEFLIRTFLSNTQGSSFQHAKVYGNNVSASQKQVFQNDFRRKLRALEIPYRNLVTEENHITTIRDFANQLSQAHPNVLANGRLRIGIAQKAINLYLKFLWSIDLIHEPPHCPVDRIVLTALGNNTNWTELDDIQDYLNIINSIRSQGGNGSPSQWEYNLWHENAQQGT
jgi:hypothetical protein